MFYDLAHLDLHPTLIYISWTKLCICDCSAVCISDRQNTKLEIRALFAAMLNCNNRPNNCDTGQIMVIPLTGLQLSWWREISWTFVSNENWEKLIMGPPWHSARLCSRVLVFVGIATECKTLKVQNDVRNNLKSSKSYCQGKLCCL